MRRAAQTQASQSAQAEANGAACGRCGDIELMALLRTLLSLVADYPYKGSRTGKNL